jgi:hypothetical protein
MVLAGVRDVAIVLLALESVVIGVLFVIMLIQIRQLIRVLRDEIGPILRSTQETTNTVRGTTTFVSEQIVTPLIKASSYATGTMQAVRNLLAIGRRGHDGRSGSMSEE